MRYLLLLMLSIVLTGRAMAYDEPKMYGPASVFVLGKEFSALQGFVRDQRPTILQDVTSQGRQVLIFDSGADTGSRPPPELFQPKLPGCDVLDAEACCPDGYSTIATLTTFGWIDTREPCYIADFSGYVPVKALPDDLSQSIMKTTGTISPLLYTTSEPGQELYLNLRQDIIKISASSDGCDTDNVGSCWKNNTDTVRCERKKPHKPAGWLWARCTNGRFQDDSTCNCNKPPQD